MNDEIQKLLNSAADDKNHSSVSFAEREFSGLQTLREAFFIIKTNILNVESWNKAATLNSFKLYDENGQERENLLFKENLFIRIFLKGSGKYDWVKIAHINERENFVIITVQPTYDPTDKNPDKTRISHFLTSESNNNFCLQKEADRLSFYVIGLNEKQNVSEAKNTFEIIRNAATANLGSYLGIQKSEWKAFSVNMLDSDKSK